MMEKSIQQIWVNCQDDMSHVTRKPEVCDQLQKQKSLNLGYSNHGYHTILAANNNKVDQTARMRRLICIFHVSI